MKNISLPATLGISSSTKLCAVIGNPIAHSLSPLIHNRWYYDHSINAVYLAFPVDSGKVEETISTLYNIGARGANITLPHKIEALQACDRFTERVKKIGATNSVLFKKSEIIGDNTDSEGFARDIRAHQSLNFSSQKFFNKVCVWGAGGAAQAVLYALSNLRVKEVLIINRTLNKGKEMVEKVGRSFFSFRVVSSWEQEKEFVAGCTLFVNATSVGMKEEKNETQDEIAGSQKEKIKMTGEKQLAECSQIAGDDGRGDGGGSASQVSLLGGARGVENSGDDGRGVRGAVASQASQNKQKTIFPEFSQIVKNPQQALAYDLVYNPINTEFLISAKRANMKTASGIGMLVAQAAISFESWFGISPITSQENYASLIKQLTNHIEKN